MGIKEVAFSGVKWTTIGSLGRASFQILQVSILTRFLPKEAFGLVAMALFVIQFSNLFVELGLSSAILHRQRISTKEASSLYWLSISFSILIYGVLFLISSIIANFYNQPELILIIRILGANIVFIAVGQQNRVFMQKRLEFKQITIVDLSSFFIALLGALILAFLDFGVYSLVYSTLLASFLGGVSFLLLNLKQNRICFFFSLVEIKPFLRIGGFTFGSSLLDFFSREIDILIVGKTLGAEALGVYSLTKQVVTRLYGIINPVISGVLNPLMARLQKERLRLKVIYLKVVSLSTVINLFVYLVLVSFSKEILLILYGVEYVSGKWLLSFFAISYAISSISSPVGSLQIATGRTDLGLIWTVFRVIITSFLVFVGSLISLNMVGFSHVFLSLTLLIPLWGVQLRPMAEVKLYEYLGQFYKPLLLFFMLSLVASSFAYINGNTFSIMEILLKGLIVILLYFPVLYFSGNEIVIELVRFLMQKERNL